MNGYPKTIGTGRDLYNCLAMVQAGTLEPHLLRASIKTIEARKWITCPIISMSDDRKAVTIRYCNEATEGQVIGTGAKIVTVEHLYENDEPQETRLTLSNAIQAATTEVLLPSAVSTLDKLGITQEQYNGISEVLKQYE